MAEQIANLATAQERFSRLTLKELRHVLLLQQTLSFNRAAELAGVSQSALSQSIARIEKRLGVVLFNRNRRSVSATAFAELIAERAESVLNALDDMDSRIVALRESREGGLRFGMGIAPAALVLNDAIAAFHQQHANVDVRAVVDLPDELARQMAASELEFLVVADLAQFRDVDALHERLFSHRHVIAFRPGHPLSELASVSFRDCIRYPVVSYPSRYLRPRYLQLINTSDEFELIDRNFPAIQLQQPILMAELVSKSDFVIWAPETVLADWVDSGRLVTRVLSDLDDVFDVNLVWKRDVRLSPASEGMIAILREVAARVENQHLGGSA